MSEVVAAMPAKPHRFAVTVYWEDTDAAGIVYYANYLKFIERARSDLVARAGIDQAALLERDGIVFPVRRCCIDYVQPARLGDQLSVSTELRKLGDASVDLHQAVEREGETLARADIRLACIGRDGRPLRLPSAVRQAFGAVQSALKGI